MSLLDTALPTLPRDAVFRFTERPSLVAPTDRLAYRIAILVTSLSYCRQLRSSFARLTLLNFAARSQRLRTSLTRVVRGLADPTEVVARFDPFFPRVLALGVANGLISQRSKGSHFALSSHGAHIAREIKRNNLFAVERDFFSNVAEDLTEAAVVRILSGRD